jgi:aminopeptidase YwaD
MSTVPTRRSRGSLGGRISRSSLGLAALLGTAGLGSLAAPRGAAAPVVPAAPGRAGQPAPRPAFVPPAAEALVAGEVDQARMQAAVHELVRLGPRMGGTPSGDRAAAAIAAAFAGAGLTPETIEDPPHPVHWEDSWTVELVPGGRLAAAYPYGFSPSIGPVTAPLAVAADPAGLASAPPRADWRGKILFVPGDVVRDAYRRIAAAAGRPLAILTDAPGDGRRYLDAAYIAALPAMPGGGPRPIPVFSLSYDDGRKVAAAATVRVALRSADGEGRPRTVLATLPGRDPDRYYLICAHGDSDSGGPGADDNGSGEAVVLELARVLAGLVRGGRLPAPRAGLRFAVWGSEYASSSAYVARAGERLRRCLGVVNLDEVGTGAERDAIYFESNEVPWNRALLRAFDRVGADYAGRPGFWPECTTNPSQGGTDSYAFLPRRYKGVLASDLRIPATTVYTAAWDRLGRLRQTPGWESPATPDPVHLAIDYSRYYHSSGDTPENTTDRKPEAMVRAARAIGIALLRLAFQAPAG